MQTADLHPDVCGDHRRQAVSPSIRGLLKKCISARCSFVGAGDQQLVTPSAVPSKLTPQQLTRMTRCRHHMLTVTTARMCAGPQACLTVDNP